MKLSSGSATNQQWFHEAKRKKCLLISSIFAVSILNFHAMTLSSSKQRHLEEENNRSYLKRLSTTGRMGNIMFAWASTMGIAERNNMEACHVGGRKKYELLEAVFTGSFPECGDASVDYEWDGGGFKKYVPDFVSDHLDDHRNIGLRGYLQSYRNFDQISDLVRETFTLHPIYQQGADAFLNEYRTHIKVGIHVRRGDINEKMPFLLPTTHFFENSMAKMRTIHGPRVKFFIATDDPEWCKTQNVFLQDDVVLRLHKNENATVDFSILQQMDHIILSYGTFGWWAAWLGAFQSGGTVLYHTTNSTTDDVDFYPESWVQVTDDRKQ